MSVFKKIADRLIQKELIPAEDREIYAYGFDILFYTIWSTAVLILIGLLFGQFPDAVVLIAVFYTFQTAGGGYHADTHWKCLLSMVIGLVVGLVMCRLSIPPVVLWILMAVGTVVLLILPLVLHPNKAFLEEKRIGLSIRSVIVTFCVLAAAITLSLFFPRLLCAFAMSSILAAVSRIAGKVAYSKASPADLHSEM